MTYKELRDRQQKEVDAFPFIFIIAGTDEEVTAALKKAGVNDPDELKPVCAGGYIRKKDAPEMEAMFRRHEEERQQQFNLDPTGEHFIKEMFKTELDNHEYSYTGELADTLNALGLTLDEINNNPALKNGLALALREYDKWLLQ